MYIRFTTFTLLLLTSTLYGFGVSAIAQESQCLDLNDQLVQSTSPENTLEAQLLEWRLLSTQCPNVPHILHNLGVINAKLGDFDSAATYFKQSLENEPRANQSYQQLNRIYRHQAVNAYRKALQPKNSVLNTPSFDYQLSTLQNFQNDKANQVAHLTTNPNPDLHAMVEHWLQDNTFDAPVNSEFLLIVDTQKPICIIHTIQRSIVLEFTEIEGQWHILKESTIP